MIAALAVAAENASIEGVPWWVYPIAVPVLGLLLAAGRKLLRLEESPGTQQAQSPPQMPTPPQVQQIPTTADGQLEFARELVAEIKADRDGLARQVKDLERRVQEQDALIMRLQAVIDRLAPPR